MCTQLKQFFAVVKHEVLCCVVTVAVVASAETSIEEYDRIVTGKERTNHNLGMYINSSSASYIHGICMEMKSVGISRASVIN